MKGRYHEMITAGSLNDDNDDDELVNIGATVNEYPNGVERIQSKQMFNIEENGFQQFSIDDMEKESAKKSNHDSIQYWKIIIRTLKLARPEWLITCLASIASLIIGTSYPMFSILFGEMYGVSIG